MSRHFAPRPLQAGLIACLGPVLVKAEVKDNKVEFTLPKDKPAYESYGNTKSNT